jgi:ArsR family transcriptional regulator
MQKTCEVRNEKRPGQDQIEKLEETMAQLPDEDQLQIQAERFKSLSDSTRLKILYLLRDGELCVCEIIYALKKPQSTISHHLNVLRKARFIKWRKEGIWIHYRLSNDKILDLIDDLTGEVMEWKKGQ